MDDAVNASTIAASDAARNSATSGMPGSDVMIETTDDTALLRELVLKAHPDVVPELVRGETVADMLASVSEAQAAYQRIVETQAQPLSRSASISAIPGGGTVRTPSVNAEGMSAMAKIRSGLATNTGQ